MARAAAIIVENDTVALIERRRSAETYYLFPGGTVEEGESLEQAVVREVLEEMGVEIEVGRLVAEVRFNSNLQYYFLARITSGDFGSGMGAEIIGPSSLEKGTYLPVWLPLAGLTNRPVHPRPVAEIVERSPLKGWPAGLLRVVDLGREAPQAAA